MKNRDSWLSHLIIFIISLQGVSFLVSSLILNDKNSHILGSILIFSVLLLYQKKSSNLNYYYPLIVALWTGEIGLIIGIDYPNNLLIIAILQIIIFYFINNYFQRVTTILIATIAIIFFVKKFFAININIILLFFILFYTLLFLFLSFKEKIFTTNRWLYPLRDGILISLYITIFIRATISQFRMIENSHFIEYNLFLILSLGAILIYTIYVLMEEYKNQNKFIYPLAFLFILLFYPTPELVGVFTIILINFYKKERIFTTLSILIGIIFIGYWYYNLEVTLLYKSIFMMSSGVFLLLIYYFRRKYAKKNHTINNNSI